MQFFFSLSQSISDFIKLLVFHNDHLFQFFNFINHLMIELSFPSKILQSGGRFNIRFARGLIFLAFNVVFNFDLIAFFHFGNHIDDILVFEHDVEHYFKEVAHLGYCIFIRFLIKVTEILMGEIGIDDILGYRIDFSCFFQHFPVCHELCDCCGRLRVAH